MQILIFGGTGFVGQHLAKRLLSSGHEVLIPSRRAQPCTYGQVISYNPDHLDKLFAQIHAPYAVVNLAGESINSGRWSNERKQSILESRIKITKGLVAAIEHAPRKPEVLINASAIGYYGYSEAQVFTEADVSGHGFLSEVTSQWEHEALQASSFTRVVLTRLGVVLGRDGGALPRMVMPYSFFIGGRVGTGNQWLSWIHIEDVTGMLESCLTDETIHGPVNVTAPTPVTMEQFGRTVARVLHRPHWLPVPAFALKLLLGEMSEIVLQGQQVLPQTMQSHGFTFTYQSVDAALKSLLD